MCGGLWPAGPGLFHGGAGRGTHPVPQTGFVAAAVVGDHPLWVDTDQDVPGGGTGPEPGSSNTLFVVEDL